MNTPPTSKCFRPASRVLGRAIAWLGAQANRPRGALTPGLAGTTLGVLIGLIGPSAALAAPEGGVITGGSGSIARPDANTTRVLQHSVRLSIDWQRFNIGAGETVNFVQPSASAAVLNRIADQRPSQIFGALKANGRVFLINPNGVVFGTGARVKVSSLVASTLDLSAKDFMSGRFELEALSDDPGAIVNRGLIEAASGGSVTLIGGSVANEGSIVAELGQVTLAAGTKATLDFDGDGLIKIGIDGAVLNNREGVEDAVSHTGEMRANGGQVLLHAAVASEIFDRAVNTDGVVKAGHIESRGGVVRLSGLGGAVRTGGVIDVAASTKGGRVEVFSDTAVDARGAVNADGGDRGGDIALESAGTTVVNSGRLSARASAGQGGSVAVLGERVGVLGASDVDVSGANGGGTILVGGGYQGVGDTRRAVVTVVGSQAQLAADATASGDGGSVVVWSDQATQFAGTISARGGPQGGDGGQVETSGKQVLQALGTVDASATGQGRAGTWLLDPTDIELRQVITTMGDDSTVGSFDGGNPNIFSAALAGPAIADIDQIVASLESGSSVTIMTQGAGGDAGDITVVDSIGVTLNSGDVTLALIADNALTVNNSISASGASTLELALTAVADIALNAALTSNGGDIALTTSAGNIALANIESIVNAGAGSAALSAGNGDITTGGAAVDVQAGGTVSLSARAIGATNRLDIQNALTLNLSDTGAGVINLGESTTSTIGSTEITVSDAASGLIDVTYFGGDVVDIDGGHVLAGITLDHTFAYIALAGGITDTGTIAIGGSTAAFTTSQADATITLDDLSSSATLSFNTAGTAGDVVLDNGTTALVLGTSSINGSLNATAGNVGGISDASGNTISVANGASFTTDAANGVVVLDSLDLTGGGLGLATNGNGAATIVNTSALDFATSTLGGMLDVTATTGAITQTGALSVAGAADFATSANDQNITLANPGNNFQDGVSASTVTAGGHTGAVVFANGANPLTLAASSITGPLTVTAGGLTISGSITASAQDYSGAGAVIVEVGGLLTLDASAATGNVTFGTNDINSNSDDANALSIIGGANDSLILSEVGTGVGGRFSGLTLLSGAAGGLSIEDVTTSGAQTYTVGAGGLTTLNGNYLSSGTVGADSISFNGNVALAGNAIVQSAGGSGDNVVFDGDITGVAGTRDLQINAGASGTVQLGTSTANSAGTAGTRLGAVDLDGAGVTLNAVLFVDSLSLDGNAGATDTLTVNGAVDAATSIIEGASNTFSSVALAANLIATDAGTGIIGLNSGAVLGAAVELAGATGVSTVGAIDANGESLTISTDAPTLGALADNAGGGALFISPFTASADVGLNNSASTFNLSAAELLAISGFSAITIGHASGTGALAIGGDGAANLGATTYDLTLRGGAATFANALTLGNDRTLALQSAGVTSSGASDVIIGGTLGHLALTSTADVAIRTELSRLSANVMGALDLTNTGDLTSVGAVVVTGLLAVTTPGVVTLTDNVTASALDLSAATGGIVIGAPLTVDVSAAAGDADFTGSALSGGGNTLTVAADGVGTSNVLFAALSGISTLSIDTGSDDLVVLGRGANTVSVTTLDVSQTAGVLELEGDLAVSSAIDFSAPSGVALDRGAGVVGITTGGADFSSGGTAFTNAGADTGLSIDVGGGLLSIDSVGSNGARLTTLALTSTAAAAPPPISVLGSVFTSGNQTYSGADISLGVSASLNGTGASTLTLRPDTVSRAISIGSPGASAAFDLSDAELARVSDGFSAIDIGYAGTGEHTITVGSLDNSSAPSDSTAEDPINLHAPTGAGSITVSGALAATGDGSVNFFGPVTLGGVINLSITTEGAPMVFSDDVIIGDVGVDFDTTANGNPGGADITFSGRLDSETGEFNPLTLLAGTGGDVSFNSAVGEASATSGMGVLTVSSGNDVTFNQDINAGSLVVTNAGIVTFGAGTVSLTGVTADGAGGSTPTALGLDLSGAGSSIALTDNVGVDTTAASAAGLNIDLSGAPIAGGGNSLDLNAGSGGTITLAAVDDTPLTLTNSAGVTVSGTIGAGTQRSLTVTGASAGGEIVFQDNVSVSALNVADNGLAYNVSLLGANNNVTSGPTAFAHQGNLVLGDDPGDSSTFAGGLQTTGNPTNPAQVDVAGALSTSNTAMTLGAVRLTSDATLNTGTGTLEVGAVSEVGTRSLTITDSGAVQFTNAIALGGDLTQTNAATGATIFDGAVGVSNATLRGTAVELRDALTATGTVTVTATDTTIFDGVVGVNNATLRGTTIELRDALTATGAVTVTADHIGILSAAGGTTARLTLMPLTDGLDIVLGSGDFLTLGGPNTFSGFSGELSLGGIASDDATEIAVSAGSIVVDRTINVGGAGGDLTVVSLGDILVDQASAPGAGRLIANDVLTVIALGVQPGTSGDINDTSRTPGAFQGNEAIFLASGDIGADVNPVTAAVVTLSAGAGSGADPQFDVPPGGAAPSSSVTLDQTRDAIASAFNQAFAGDNLFSTLSTNVNVDTSTETGRETTLGELGFLDESVFREFTLFAVEIGILVPWYADENFPTLPKPEEFRDVDGNLDEELWVQAVAEFMEAVERKLVDDGVAESERARIRDEVIDYLAKRRLRNISPVRNFSAQAPDTESRNVCSAGCG